MIYQTAQHAPPPDRVLHGGYLVPTAPLIARNDTAKLADLGIYPHITVEGPAPLGYTEWVLIDGAYHREPAGTPEERQAAMTPPEPTIEERRAAMEVSRLQARLALIHVDLWPAVVAYFADPARTEVEKAFFEDAQVWKRTDPTLQAACAAFEMTDEQVDNLFTLAATL